MDISPQDTTTQPISDDQELAKALAGVLPEEEAPANDTGMQFEETPGVPVIQLPNTEVEETPTNDTPAAQGITVTTPEVDNSTETVAASPELSAIKDKALDELRPLIDKATLPAEEKFDTYLMLIRSTDDTSLIGPAHDAAQAITDETRKAEALIDIIKEIDYLSKKSV